MRCQLVSGTSEGAGRARVRRLLRLPLGYAMVVQSYRRPGNAPPDLQVQLRACPESVADARAEVSALSTLDAETHDALLIVVSELVTNAVRHAGLPTEARVTLRATRLGNRVRVEVIDGGRGFDREQVARVQPSAAGGFGLRIVDQLSDRWGVVRNRGMVWAEVPTPPGAGTAH